jgi:hypothetical protein
MTKRNIVSAVDSPRRESELLNIQLLVDSVSALIHAAKLRKWKAPHTSVGSRHRKLTHWGHPEFIDLHSGAVITILASFY